MAQFSWDVGFDEVRVNFPDDAIPWCRWLLVLALGGGHLVCCTPYLDIELTDLVSYAVLPLQQRARFPAGVAADGYVFDPLTDEVTDGIVELALLSPAC